MPNAGMVKLHFVTSSPPFDYENDANDYLISREETARILRQLADKLISDGKDFFISGGDITDKDGNWIGEWEWSP